MTTAAECGDGPLRGVRVVELAGIGPGPFAAMVLADLGADVVRVERPGGAVLGIDPRSDVTNRNKRSVTVDLKSEDGVAAVLDLVSRADVLIEGNRPGVAERLGVGPEACLARNPRLVYGRMTGWGQDGPLAQRAGHDIGYIALTGVLGMTGPAGGPPYAAANLLGDYAGGSLYLVIGVLAALQHARAEGGEGQVVDAAIVDGTSHLSAMIHGMMAAGAWQDRRGSNLLDGGAPFYGTYETADGGFMAVGALEPQFYGEFVRLLGIEDDVPDRADPGAWGELRAAVATRFKERTRQEWTAVFEGSDACVAPVLSLREAPAHPHLAARGTFVEYGGITQPAPAPRFSATPTGVSRPPAVPGADAAEVARDWRLPVLDPDHPRSAGSAPDTARIGDAAARTSTADHTSARTADHPADHTTDDTDPAEDADA
ncbi:CaiB/BaiF CoA transferase family protein [Streptomyces ovatisporus]|uniref:CaiB/BaiF CoA transferase family protein n=1 Tax=Streptomyces ovatisporus TaxID=1128682 RepID=A0ABV9A9Y6_9ACTN